MTALALEVDGLTKRYRVAHRETTGFWSATRALFHREYKTVEAVTDVSFRIEAGEMVAFLGPNGAGKTTTLKMLSGLIYPSSGTAQVLGHVPWLRSDAYRRQFALVMGQKNQLWWDLPASESFRLHREIYRIPSDDFQAIHDELVDLLHVGKLIGRPVRELSLGERMKMELIAALLHSPKVVFLDEPTIGLDVVAQSQLRGFLRDYNLRREVTVVLTSHYMKDVESLCDRVIVINHGRIMYDGSLEGILNEFSSVRILKVQFAGDAPEELHDIGEIVERKGPVATLRIHRTAVPATLSRILQRYQIEDITVDEVPLEEVIAAVFQQAKPTNELVPTTTE